MRRLNLALALSVFVSSYSLAQVTINDVLRERSSSVALAMRLKPDDDQKFEHDLNDLFLTDQQKDQLRHLRQAYFPEAGHVIRLLSPHRSSAERELGLAICTYWPSILEELRKSHLEQYSHLRNVIALEGPDTTLWWTFAPYLLRSQKVKGTSELEALRKVILWALTGHHLYEDFEGIGLAGLDRNHRLFILSNNPDGASHRYAAQEAERIVSSVELFVSEDCVAYLTRARKRTP